MAGMRWMTGEPYGKPGPAAHASIRGRTVPAIAGLAAVSVSVQPFALAQLRSTCTDANGMRLLGLGGGTTG